MLDSRCTVCRSFLDIEDLFCSNCGTENPSGQDAQGTGRAPEKQPQQIPSVLSFRCDQCGASMSYDPNARELRCPFCGSERMKSRPDARTLRPHSVLPFVVPDRDVEKLIRDWLGKGFWRPGDAAEASVIRNITKVFVPFWVFSGSVETAWTADTSAVPAGARGNWKPISGALQRNLQGVLVCASGILTPLEVREIAPFDLSRAVAPEEVDLVHTIVEEFRVTKRDARSMAVGVIDQMIAQEVQGRIQGSTRNIRVNNRIQNMTSLPMLLPIWILAYSYNEKTYRVLVNGQTREVYGIAPFSNAKLAIIVAVVFAIVLAIIVLVVIGSIASHHL